MSASLHSPSSQRDPTGQQIEPQVRSSLQPKAGVHDQPSSAGSCSQRLQLAQVVNPSAQTASTQAAPPPSPAPPAPAPPSPAPPAPPWPTVTLDDPVVVTALAVEAP